MKQKEQNITIVGAGHYGRNLIAPIYASLPRVRFQAIISTHITPEILEKTPLAGVPILRSFKEWKRLFGTPTHEDVFDLCVHHPILPELLKKLSEIGGMHCILPKPVAVTQKNWDVISRVCKKYNLRCAVASQWYYSRLTTTLAAAYKTLAQKTPVRRIAMECSQEFTDMQLIHYSPISGFLPHMFQILSSIGIQLAALGECTVIRKDLRYEIKYGRPVPISMVTDMGPRPHAAKKVRTVRVFTEENLPALETDFYKIEENVLLTMTKKILVAFAEETVPFVENHEALSLENYGPIARELIALNALMTTPNDHETASGTDQ